MSDTKLRQAARVTRGLELSRLALGSALDEEKSRAFAKELTAIIACIDRLAEEAHLAGDSRFETLCGKVTDVIWVIVGLNVIDGP